MTHSIRREVNRLALAIALFAQVVALSSTAEAVLTYMVESGGWPDTARRDAAVIAMQNVVDRYNAYGNFGNYNVYVYYNSGIPTAQASYLGSIGFGQTYPDERVTMHELAHYLGSGTYGTPWDGFYGEALIDQFDGLEESLNGDSQHFWPYGLNYPEEGSEINKQRQVAMVYAQRADMGIGPSAHPSTATTVTLTVSDPFGTSGFNYKDQWSDGYFAHAGADYFTGDYAMRTPVSTNSFSFAGDSLTLDNSNGELGGLFYKGQGSTGIVSFDSLILDGGWIQHQNSIGDLFQLDGNLDVVSDSSIRAKQGNINILADVSGAGALTIQPTDSPAQNNRYVRLFSSNNNFVGDIVNESRFELADGANQKFVIGAPGINNAITGETALATQLNGVFEFDLSGASSTVGDSWSIVSATNTTFGLSFSVAGFTEANNTWSDDEYEFSEATGMLTVLPAPSTWNVDGGGMWSAAGNWSGGVPATDGRAILGPVLSGANAPATIQLDTPASLRRLTFDNANPYILGGANTLTLVGAAEIVANNGDHEVTVVIAGSSGLSVSGGGKVTLSAVNTYNGETNINAGTLALSGTATIANSPHINVTPNGTLDVTAAAGGSYALNNQMLTIDGDVEGNIVATNNSTVHVNSTNSMNGNLNAQSGSLVTGVGRIAGNLSAESGAVIQVGSLGLTFSNTRFLIDDFETYAVGNVRDVASPPWTAHGGAPGTQFADIENDAGNKVLTFGWSGDARGTSRDLPEEGQIDNSEIATFFFRFNSKTDDPDHNFGLADDLDTSLDANFGDFEAQFRLVQGTSSGSFAVNARNGGSFTANLATGLSLNTWYNVWMVVNQTTDTYDVYMSTGLGDATAGNKLNASPLQFRNGTIEPLSKILGLAGAAPIDNGVRYDTLTYLSGVDLRNPLGSTPPTFLGESQTLTVEGDFTMNAGTTLQLDIVNPNILDLLDVTGQFNAGGALQVTLLEGAPAPQLGDAFGILDFGSSSGSFDTYQLPGLTSGLAWSVANLLTTGELQVVQDVDLDDDGDVDGDDFLVIQRTNPALIPAWESLYGSQVVTPLAAASSAVPEPASLLLVLFGCSGLALCRKFQL